MTREEFIKRVALKMDEISSSDDVIIPVGTGDNNPLYTQINNLINESVNEVLMKAPIYRLNSYVANGKSDTILLTDIFDGDRKVATIALPDDFLRLGSIWDSEFHRPIVNLAMEGDEVANRQYNKNLVAKAAKPVAVLGTKYSDSKAQRIITCYSYSKDKTSTTLSYYYIKRYENDKITTEETGLDDYVIDAASWVCASKTFSAQGDINKSKLCDENAIALMV